MGIILVALLWAGPLPRAADDAEPHALLGSRAHSKSSDYAAQLEGGLHDAAQNNDVAAAQALLVENPGVANDMAGGCVDLAAP